MRRKIIVLMMFFVCAYFLKGAVELKLSSKIESKDVFKPIKLFFNDSKLYLFDSSDYCVKCIDLKGKQLFKAGKRGEGPGELAIPTDFNIKDNKIYIFDSKAKKFEMFLATDGKSIGIKKVNLQGGFKFYFWKNDVYFSGIKFMKGQQLIHKLVEKNNEYELAKSLLECIPMKGSQTDMYKNFGFIAVFQDNLFFARAVVNWVDKVSLSDGLVKTITLPIESLDLSKLKQGGNMILNQAVNYDIRVCNNNLYLLSGDLKKEKTVIFIWEDNKFKEKYIINEPLLSFDITKDKIFAIGIDDFEIFEYDLKQK